jgi:hypothetical protein
MPDLQTEAGTSTPTKTAVIPPKELGKTFSHRH